MLAVAGSVDVAADEDAHTAMAWLLQLPLSEISHLEPKREAAPPSSSTIPKEREHKQRETATRRTKSAGKRNRRLLLKSGFSPPVAKL